MYVHMYMRVLVYIHISSVHLSLSLSLSRSLFGALVKPLYDSMARDWLGRPGKVRGTGVGMSPPTKKRPASV